MTIEFENQNHTRKLESFDLCLEYQGNFLLKNLLFSKKIKLYNKSLFYYSPEKNLNNYE